MITLCSLRIAPVGPFGKVICFSPSGCPQGSEHFSPFKPGGIGGGKETAGVTVVLKGGDRCCLSREGQKEDSFISRILARRHP